MDPARKVALLVHADGAVDAVVDHDEERRRPVLHRRGEFLAGHQEAAVARESKPRRGPGCTSLAAMAAGTP